MRRMILSISLTGIGSVSILVGIRYAFFFGGRFRRRDLRDEASRFPIGGLESGGCGDAFPGEKSVEDHRSSHVFLDLIDASSAESRAHLVDRAEHAAVPCAVPREAEGEATVFRGRPYGAGLKGSQGEYVHRITCHSLWYGPFAVYANVAPPRARCTARGGGRAASQPTLVPLLPFP